MKRHPALTASADRHSELPRSLDARRDRIARALRSLDDEARRIERLGLDEPRRRCAEERRFWTFLDAVHGMAVPAEPRLRDAAPRIATRSRFA